MDIYRCFEFDYHLKLPDFYVSRTKRQVNAFYVHTSPPLRLLSKARREFKVWMQNENISHQPL